MKAPVYILNILILAIYMALLQSSGPNSYFPSFGPIIIHVSVNIVIGFVLVAIGKPNSGAFFLSSCLVLLIGFPTRLALG